MIGASSFALPYILIFAGILAVAGVVADTVAWAAAVAVVGMWFLQVALFGDGSVLGSGYMPVFAAWAIATTGNLAINMLSARYLSRQAIQHEAPELDWLRRLGLWFRCGGGTDFRRAVLTGANFANSRMDYARFADTTLNHTHWRNAVNLHLANTYG